LPGRIPSILAYKRAAHDLLSSFSEEGWGSTWVGETQTGKPENDANHVESVRSPPVGVTERRQGCEQDMPAKSKKQQMAAGAALSAKRGGRGKESLRGASRGMYESMSRSQLRHLAKTKRQSLPVSKRKG
jgi:hypothetical protein